MAEQYAGALLYLVPVVVAAVVAFIVTRPEKDDTAAAADETLIMPPARPYGIGVATPLFGRDRAAISAKLAFWRHC